MFAPLRLRCLLTLWLALAACELAQATPFRPTADQQVLETLPARLSDPRQREMRELRQALAAQPSDADLAVRLAQRYYAEVAAEGDPRYIGYAQAALAPWWHEPAPPPQVRLMRAVLLQFSHQFDAARADLHAVLLAEPGNGEAWAWLLAISLVQADYTQAHQACARLSALAPGLIGSACRAQLDALTGHSAAAALALRAALAREAQADPAQKLWALTRLAEIEQRHGDAGAAEAAFRQALALDINDGYLLAAYADYLLDQGRAAEVLALLREHTRSDLLLLRLALAAKAMGAPERAKWQDELAARFDAARLRGDVLHQKEEARFALALQGQSERALALAGDNYALQREPADARILLEAALATKRPDAARPVLQWLAASGYDGIRLNALAQSLRGGD